MGKKIIIYGAGAIGRGFLAPYFSKQGYEIFFVDKNKELINELQKRDYYVTAFSEHFGYELIKVPYSGAFLLGEEDAFLPLMDFAFCCVGPTNTISFAKKLSPVTAIISFENEYESVENISRMSHNKNCAFGIPDVITSNEAPGELKKIDPLCLVSEKGELAVETGDFFLKGVSIYSKEEMQKFWACKFYLHNTPHATAAFLGKLFGCIYLHEAMQIPIIEKAVRSVMDSTKKAMKIKKMADASFIDFYAQKEITRFKDRLLFDPIARVGREPLRKLRAHDRLVQSIKFITETKQEDWGVLVTIKAALYDALNNSFKESKELLGTNPTESELLQKICGFEKQSAFYSKINSANLFSLLFSEHSEKKPNKSLIRAIVALS